MTSIIRIWDLPTRLFHWALVVLCFTMIVSGKAGWLHLHMAVGPAVLALILFRLVWGVVGSTTARFSFFVKGPRAVLDYIRLMRAGRDWPGIGHNPLGSLSVLALLALPVMMVGTGLFTTDDVMTDGPLVPLVSSHAVKLLSGLHRLTGSLVLAVVATHICAVLFYRFVKHDDLIWPMIVGTKQSPQGPIPQLSFVSPLLALGVAVVMAAVVWGGLWYLMPVPE